MKEWHESAKRLHEVGVSVKDIAYAFDKDEATVRYALDINGAKDKNRARARKSRENRWLNRCTYIWKDNYLARAS